ncbi:MAG TPA: T9SS type A sorting domain-containing protein [Chitinophagaceae bacterium]|nr:T9SS type A sorting domain-containing protein [Chitinophagaceae bacterium]
MMAIETSMNWLLWTVVPTTSSCYEKNQGVSGLKKYHLSFLPQLNFYPGDLYSFNVNGIVENDDSSIVIFYKDQQQTYGNPVNVSTLTTPQILQPNSISIYPNPSQDGIFYIDLHEQLNWNVFSFEGNLISSGNQSQINLNGYNKGIYLITIQSASGTYHSTLQIQ